VIQSFFLPKNTTHPLMAIFNRIVCGQLNQSKYMLGKLLVFLLISIPYTLRIVFKATGIKSIIEVIKMPEQKDSRKQS
jgi:hypothetical protein